jgi:WD40-like Beta Propeller Repeat
MRGLAHSILLKLGRGLVLSAIVAALAPAVALASFPGQDGVIAYTGAVDPSCYERCPPSHEGIWALEPKTDDQFQLTAGPDSDPSFSPSGNLLAFQRPVGERSMVFVKKVDGSQARPLVEGEEPTFAPNGRQIAFVYDLNLFVTGLVAGAPVRLLYAAPSASFVMGPRWSSTGEIVFQSYQQSRNDDWRVEIDIIDPPSSRVRTVLTVESQESLPPLYPDWSPHGQALAVALCHVGQAVTSSKGVADLVLHEDCRADVWAPHGQRLAAPGTGDLKNKPNTTCPEGPVEGDPISWQPLVSGTLRIATVRCKARRPLPGERVYPSGTPSTETKASHTSVHSRNCQTIKHRYICFPSR